MKSLKTFCALAGARGKDEAMWKSLQQVLDPTPTVPGMQESEPACASA